MSCIVVECEGQMGRKVELESTDDHQGGDVMLMVKVVLF